MKNPRISFGIIVLNGEPFTKYCLRQLYPFAHEIIVSEGAVEGADAVSTTNGHSVDGTLEALYSFKTEEDPDNKLTIVPHNGFWYDKNEQSIAYSVIATGDYLWQIDIDEFYRNDDILKIINMLEHEPEVAAVVFPTITFWGSPKYHCNSYEVIRRHYYEVFRIFKWDKGYKYIKHIRPTVVDEKGKDLRKKKIFNGRKMRKCDIWMYHYSLLFPAQVKMKGIYYSSRKNRAKVVGWNEWMHNSYLSLRKPFRTYHRFQYPGWLERFSGKHPEQIEIMWNDINSGKINISTRQTEDVENIIDSLWYRAGILILKIVQPFDWIIQKFWRGIKRCGPW